MALFGKKKRTLDEILADIESLSPEEKAQLQEKMSAPEASEDELEAEKVEESVTDTPEVTEEVTEESAEVSAEDTPDEAADVADVSPDEPVAEPAPEAPVEEKAEDTTNETFEAMAARLAAIEEHYSTLIEKVEAMAERLDGGDFGNHRGTLPEGNEDAESEESRVMRSYYRKQGDARRY